MQVSSLTSSPDSSPSPIAVALGQVGQTTITAAPNVGSIEPPFTTHHHNNSGAPAGSTPQQPTSASQSDSKHWHAANSTTHSLSPKQYSYDPPAAGTDSANSTTEPLRVSPMIREFVQSVDDREWQNSLYGLLQNQTYNQCEVDLFELMCKVLDQNLFSQVDWARNTVFFKDLKVSFK